MPDLNEIQDLIDLMRRSGVSELSLELPDYKLHLKLAPEGPHVSAAALPLNASDSAPAEAAPGFTILAEVVSVTSPVVGVFHNGGMEEPRTPVSVGDRVEEGQLLAVVEAMRVPHEVHAPVSGVTAQVLAQDGAAVGFGDRLFLIQPAQQEVGDDEAPIGLA